MKKSQSILIVGAGISGAVTARLLAEAGHHVIVTDKRGHTAGNCFTKRDEETGIMEHIYGPHIFNTNDEDVWHFVNRFCRMKDFTNRVKAIHDDRVFSFPINLHTLSQLEGHSLTPSQARAWVELHRIPISDPKNFEEQALALVGNRLYRKFFYGYTKKQWGCDPKQLPASIAKRLPIRFDYNDNYYNVKYQGIPQAGYTDMVDRMLDHDLITVQLHVDVDRSAFTGYETIIYTGSLDRLYEYEYGALGYRTVMWNRSVSEGVYQGNAVINYTDAHVKHTRIIEHKYFAPWEDHTKTIVSTEYSKETERCDEPFYPKRLANDIPLFEKYKRRAEADKLHLIGRLATYRYLNMDVAIGEAMQAAQALIRNKK